MEKIKNYDERRGALFGASHEEEQNIRANLLDDIADKINEIVDWINKNHGKTQ